MRLDITGRHVEITAPLRQLIDNRLARLGRLLNDSAVSAQVILTKEKYRHRAEIILHARGDHTLRGAGEGTAWPISLRQASEKIEQQAHTLKGKWASRKRRKAPRGLPAPVVESAPARRLVRPKRYPVKPMSLDDAAARLETAAENFVVFRRAQTDAVNILYRRKDGKLGLIEPE
jgi:putative sigma-54 modulation protein